VEVEIHANIETASTCNAACGFCPYIVTARERSGKTMAMDLYTKIIDEIATIPAITALNLMGLNEPLLDRRLESLIAYAKAAKPSLRIVIYTNGLLLTPARHASLREAGLDRLIVSLNAVRADQHQAIMGMKGKFDIICANIDNARQYPTPALEVHAVYTSDTFTEADAMQFYARWGNKHEGGHGLVCRDSNWAGAVEIPAKAASLVFTNLWCFRATHTIYITYDGTMTACCLDPFGKLAFGNLQTQTIREIYNSERYVAFRLAHAENRADEYDMCKTCTRV
jgi:radical SAM protein with 4Fe4S-binding SPASM domain